MVEQRNIVTAVILSIVTCGIYGIYWLIKLNDEANTITGDTEAPSGAMVFLLTLVTCGIYGWFWMYKMGNKLDDYYEAKGQGRSNRAIIYLLLSLFGLGIVSYALIQDSINKAL